MSFLSPRHHNLISVMDCPSQSNSGLQKLEVKHFELKRLCIISCYLNWISLSAYSFSSSVFSRSFEFTQAHPVQDLRLSTAYLEMPRWLGLLRKDWRCPPIILQRRMTSASSSSPIKRRWHETSTRQAWGTLRDSSVYRTRVRIRYWCVYVLCLKDGC